MNFFRFAFPGAGWVPLGLKWLGFAVSRLGFGTFLRGPPTGQTDIRNAKNHPQLWKRLGSDVLVLSPWVPGLGFAVCSGEGPASRNSQKTAGQPAGEKHPSKEKRSFEHRLLCLTLSSLEHRRLCLTLSSFEHRRLCLTLRTKARLHSTVVASRHGSAPFRL